MPNKEAMQDGYDSDGQLGPFIAKGVADEADYCMDEQPLETENRNLLPPDENEISPVQTLTDDEIQNMKVAELRNELSCRGLSKNGLKAVLVDRLKDAIAKKLPLMSKRPLVEVANTAGDGFHPSVYW